MPTAPPIPTRFPCWCRAVYSWGGESKHDLGFIEGDLIECLNAGDGSWWMGRLRRDKRVMGLFPSNFVQVLDDTFRPASRISSPMLDRTPSPSPFNPQPPQKQRTKVFRKPFQAYAAPNEAVVKRAEIQKQADRPVSRAVSPAFGGVQDNISRAQSPIIHSHGSRAPSPSPATMHYSSGATSPAPPSHDVYTLSGASPASSFQGHVHSRGPSPGPQLDVESPPPPAPPPHRSTLRLHEVNGSYSQHASGYQNKHCSSCPASPGGNRLTPSPLRSAMDDVMSSLADMGLREDDLPEVQVNPWSPEAFDQTYTNARRVVAPRPNTAMGIGGQSGYEMDPDELHFGESESNYAGDDQSPHLSNYVQRMESRLNRMHKTFPVLDDDDGAPPAVPPKSSVFCRPVSSMGDNVRAELKLRHRKSAYEVGRSVLGRTFTTKTSSTNSSSGTRSTATNTSSSTQRTDRSLMSGPSASGFSSTSAGSYARRKEASPGRAQSAMSSRRDDFLGSNSISVDYGGQRPQTPLTGISYHSCHASGPPRAQSQAGWHGSSASSDNMLGGLVAPRAKKSGFFKKIIESARTGAASARSSIAAGESSKPISSSKMPNGSTFIAGGLSKNYGRDAASDMGSVGGSGAIDWVQVRRDVNRSNSLSRIELVERKERCQMLDHPALNPVEEFFEGCDGDEGADGQLVEEPTNFQAVNLALVDKNARFINSLPPMTNPVSLATGFVCRPYRSDVQRLRAIFTWVSEKIMWEEDFDNDVDPRRVIQTKRGSAEDVALLVLEMCTAVGIHAEVVKGFLKTPGEIPELGITPRSNHWWNTVIIDGEWRFMDCSLASPSHPRRGLYSSGSGQTAESWWFLARPTEICWTHVPEQHQQQHISPEVAHEVLLTLPCACPPYFKNELQMINYDTSVVRVEDLELVHIKIIVPPDVECVAEVEARAFERDADGDFFESGEVVKKRALAQAEWLGGQKRYTVKALLPGDEGSGILKIYAGKRGLMHSIKDIPHPLAIALPMIHTGDNPPYEFVTRHPTPHAQRHDLYIAQPQCQQLALNHTFVFAIRQHPSSLTSSSPTPGDASPIPFMRPSSALSVTESSASGSNPSTRNSSSSKKPAKLAIQAPGGKVLRLMRKEDRTQSAGLGNESGDGGTWETIIKCGERGVWRGLVLADRSARWAVFAEWTCV